MHAIGNHSQPLGGRLSRIGYGLPFVFGCLAASPPKLVIPQKWSSVVASPPKLAIPKKGSLVLPGSLNWDGVRSSAA